MKESLLANVLSMDCFCCWYRAMYSPMVSVSFDSCSLQRMRMRMGVCVRVRVRVRANCGKDDHHDKDNNTK